MGITLNMQSVQGTMLLPLWGRAKYSRENPDILDDRIAERIIKESGIDFSATEKSFGEFGGLCYILRARKIDDAVRTFLKKHPRGTVVNIGAGLDTTYQRVDNGQLHWYNLDLPDAIAYRQSLLPDSDRECCIAKSFFDQSWFDDVIFNREDGILFVAGGVFYYFHPEELQVLFDAMTRRFPGGEMFFDAESKMGIYFSNKMVEKTGNKGSRMYFYVNNKRQLEGWSPRILSVSCQPYSKGIPLKKSWSAASRKRFKMLDAMGAMKFVHVRFAP